MKATPPKTKNNVPSDSQTESIKSYIKEVIADSDARMNRYIGAITEDFRHQVSSIAEQFLGLNEKLDEHGRKLDEHGRILDEHGRILNEHGRILNSHTEMIGRLMIDVEDIKVNMREKVGRDEFNKLETRLVSLESFVFSKQGGVVKIPKVTK
jgi:hypothetical protein